jgi:hypothetical protein
MRRAPTRDGAHAARVDVTDALIQRTHKYHGRADPAIALLLNPREIQEECLLTRGLLQALETSALAAVTCFHIDVQQERIGVRAQSTQARNKLGGLVVLHL